MRKVTAIVVAVILAFGLAMGDRIIELSLSGNPLGINTVKGWFGFDDGGLRLPETKPIIPQDPVETEETPAEVNLTYDQRIEKGDYYAKQGYLIYASNEYVKAADLEPSRVEPYQKLASVHYDLMNYEKARANAETVLGLRPEDPQAKYLLLLTDIRQSLFTDALTRIETLQLEGSTDPRLDYYKGLILITLGRHEEGKQSLSKTESADVLDPALRANASKILSSYEEFAFAKSAEDLYLAELLARSFNLIGEYEMAVYKLKGILNERSDLRDSWILLGFSYLNLQKYLFAVTAFEHAYQIDPEWPATQYFLGIAYAELEKYPDAIQYLDFALKNGFTPKAVIWQKLADLYLETMEYAKSVEMYEYLLSNDSSDINAFVRPIWIYLDFMKNADSALKLADQAAAKFPEDPMSYNLLGWSQTGTGDYPLAETNLKKALALKPDFAAAWYNLGKLFEAMDSKDEALSAYQKAYEHDSAGSIGNLAAKRYNFLITNP
jgi:tetratricopeptide (TPR) repeat protein